MRERITARTSPSFLDQRQRKFYELVSFRLRKLSRLERLTDIQLAETINKHPNVLPLGSGAGEAAIRHWIQKGHPITGPTKSPVSENRFRNHVLWADSVAVAFHQEPREWLGDEYNEVVPSFKADSLSVPLSGDSRVEPEGVLYSANPPEGVEQVFARLRRGLPKGGTYTVCSSDSFHQAEVGNPRRLETAWFFTKELVQKGVGVELIASSGAAVAKAKEALAEAESRGVRSGFVVRPAPQRVVRALGSECRIVIFDHGADSDEASTMDDITEQIRQGSVRVYIGTRCEGQFGPHHGWMPMVRSRAAEVVSAVRVARRESVSLFDETAPQQHEDFQPELLTSIQANCLGQGHEVTIVTGSFFLEAAKGFKADFPEEEEERVRAETLACLERGVRFRFVALPDSKATENLQVVAEWLESLEPSMRSRARSQVKLCVGPAELREYCAEKERLVAFWATKKAALKRLPHVRGGQGGVVFASVDASDDKGTPVMRYVVLPTITTDKVCGLLKEPRGHQKPENTLKVIWPSSEE